MNKNKINKQDYSPFVPDRILLAHSLVIFSASGDAYKNWILSNSFSQGCNLSHYSHKHRNLHRGYVNVFWDKTNILFKIPSLAM